MMKYKGWQKRPVFTLSAIIVLFFCTTVHDLNESRYNWLSASAIKFTNNWLSDGIAADKYTMLEQPLSIEAQTPEDRLPYISYPNGTVLLTYATAKLFNCKQIDMNFIKPLATFFYLLDAVLIGILVYLFFVYILKLKSGCGNIVLPVFLSCLWICLPNNVYFLKNAFFADQLVLVFIYLFLILELLKNYAGIRNRSKRLVIHFLLAVTIFSGMLIEYYFWLQVFVVCLINFTGSLRRKEKPADILKKLSVYILPALLATGLFLLQITQFDDWREIMTEKLAERTGQTNAIGGNYLLKIVYHLYKTYQLAGLLLFAAFTAALVYLSKTKTKTKTHTTVLKFSLAVILPVFIQLIVFMNHSAVHEFSIVKLGFPFILGLVLIAWSICIYRKKSQNYFLSLTTLLITGYLFCIQWNIADFYNKRLGLDEWEKPLGFEPAIEELNDYGNVFFSFTDSIPVNPPMTVAQTKKMVYKIDRREDIKRKFPHLDRKANILLLVNKNSEKSIETRQEERSIQESSGMIKETDNYTIYNYGKQ